MKEYFLSVISWKGNFRILHRSIIRVMADGPYSHIFTTGKEKCVLCIHLKRVKEKLKCSKYLYRVHRKHIVNMDSITGHMKKGKSCFLIMSDGSEIPVAKRKKKEFMKQYKRRKRIYEKINIEKNGSGIKNYSTDSYSLNTKIQKQF